MTKLEEIPMKPQKLLTISDDVTLFLVHLAGSAGHVCVSYRGDTCTTRQSAARTSQVFFFFSHEKMASLTVQDVEVRAPKMIYKKSYCAFVGIL